MLTPFLGNAGGGGSVADAFGVEKLTRVAIIDEKPLT